MEEKERYEIHIYDDICVDLYDNGVLDKSINDTYKLEELLNQQSKRIKELEEELDDAKRDYIPKLEFGLQRANKMCRDAEKENQQLKQQLAEKERQVKKLNLEAQKYYEDTYCNDFHNQDKISFCIEKLKKVKKLFEEKYSYDVEESDFAVIYEDDVDEIIDNEINKLTHQHGDK